MIAGAAASGARVVLLTETFSTGFSFDTPGIGEPEGGPSSQFLADRWPTTHGVWVGGSCPEIAPDAPADDQRPSNVFVLAGARRHAAPLPQDPSVLPRRRGALRARRHRVRHRRHRRAAMQPVRLLRPALRRRVLGARDRTPTRTSSSPTGRPSGGCTGRRCCGPGRSRTRPTSSASTGSARAAASTTPATARSSTRSARSSPPEPASRRSCSPTSTPTTSRRPATTSASSRTAADRRPTAAAAATRDTWCARRHVFTRSR